MEKQIVAEACGATRKEIPCDMFWSKYLCDFKVEGKPRPAITFMKSTGIGSWTKALFAARLRKVLSKIVRYLEFVINRLSLI